MSIKPPFLQVDCFVTNACNARCGFCMCGRRPAPPVREMPASFWIDTAKKLQKLAPVKSFIIGGGEPLLYRELLSLIEGVAALGIRTVVVTNGSLMSEKTCLQLAESGVSQVDLSIDCVPEVHDAMRGIPGLYHKCIHSIFMLKEIKPELCVGISTIICQVNIPYLPGLVDLLSETPVNHIHFQAYNQVVSDQAMWNKDVLLNDPMWPKDREIVVRVMDQLKKMALGGARIANHPIQFERYKSYFLDPDRPIGMSCPAGSFNFAITNEGKVNACILEAPVGDLTVEDPVTIYQERYPAIRQMARTCRNNCHLLVNCFYDSSRSQWDILNEGRDEDRSKPGRLLLPPEIRDLTKSSHPRSPDIIRYEEHRQLDIIGRVESLDDRKALAIHPPNSVPCVYLCGNTSEMHRWGADFDENDFYKQEGRLKELIAQGAIYHTVVVVRRTNFHRLPEIYNYIRGLRGQGMLDLAPLDLTEPEGVRDRFYKQLFFLNRLSIPEGIEFQIMDPRLDDLLLTIGTAPLRPGHDRRNFLMALGPVCKDVFTGPKILLLDLAGRCNVDCIYCRLFTPLMEIPKDSPRIYGLLPLEVARNALHEAKELEVQTISLVGRGEPTTHPNFAEILDEIKGLDLTFNISTNAALLHRHMDRFLDGHCTSITASLSFASQQTFSLIRPTTPPSVKERIESNLKKIAELKKERGLPGPKVVALYAICKYNYHEIIDMARHAAELGADEIWYQMIHLFDFSKEKMGLSPEEMKRVRELIGQSRDLCAELGLTWHSFIDFEIEHYNETRGDWSNKGLLYQGCYVGWSFAFVNLFLEVFMCCGGVTVGMLNDDGTGLRDIWYSPAFRRYRNDGLVMYRENPIDIFGKTLYSPYCDSCDNHDQQVDILSGLRLYDLNQFVEPPNPPLPVEIQLPGVAEPAVRLSEIQFFNSAGQQSPELAPGQSVALVVCFRVEKAVCDPLVRIQILNNENLYGESTFLFGTNTARAQLALGHLEPGDWKVRLDLHQLNLLPGTYPVTVGIWPDEKASNAFDVRHGMHKLHVLGPPEPSGTKVSIPLQWVVSVLSTEEVESCNRLGLVTLSKGEGEGERDLVPGDAARLTIDCRLADPERVRLFASILRDGRTVHQTACAERLPRGRATVALRYKSMNLLEGDYQVVVTLTDRNSGGSLATRSCSFSMHGKWQDGAGIVYNPHTWKISTSPC